MRYEEPYGDACVSGGVVSPLCATAGTPKSRIFTRCCGVTDIGRCGVAVDEPERVSRGPSRWQSGWRDRGVTESCCWRRSARRRQTPSSPWRKVTTCVRKGLVHDGSEVTDGHRRLLTAETVRGTESSRTGPSSRISPRAFIHPSGGKVSPR